MAWRWSKKKAEPKHGESQPVIDTERYAGKPLLRLLELYVIWAVGLLPDEDAKRLTAMAPKLTDTFGGDGSWQDALAVTMQMPENMPDLIRDMWAKNQAIAASQNSTLDVQAFAEMFVDRNLT